MYIENPKLNKMCSVKNCTNNRSYSKNCQYGRELCRRHYDQMRHFGKIFERTLYDKNETMICGKYCLLYLYNRKHEIIDYVIFDTIFLDKVKKYKWHRKKCPNTCYAESSQCKNKKSIQMHQLFLPCSKKYEIDHKNHDGLDNRLINLRIVTHRTNCENRKDNKSGKPGVSWDKRGKKWVSEIQVNYKHIFLGHFSNINDAFKNREKYKQDHKLI